MPGYHDDEHAAWALAEALLDKARAMMRQAEKALDTFKLGKELNRQRCARRGISETDAEIRWASTANAKNALTDNSFHAGLATMYYGAASAYYARALYLRCLRTDELIGPGPVGPGLVGPELAGPGPVRPRSPDGRRRAHRPGDDVRQPS